MLWTPTTNKSTWVTLKARSSASLMWQDSEDWQTKWVVFKSFTKLIKERAYKYSRSHAINSVAKNQEQSRKSLNSIPKINLTLPSPSWIRSMLTGTSNILCGNGWRRRKRVSCGLRELSGILPNSWLTEKVKSSEELDLRLNLLTLLEISLNFCNNLLDCETRVKWYNILINE